MNNGDVDKHISQTDLFGEVIKAPSRGPLADRFMTPPFTVLNSREGPWQDRKDKWLALGIKSEVGRGGNLLCMSDTVLEPDPEKRKNFHGLKGNAGAIRIARVGEGPALAMKPALPGDGLCLNAVTIGGEDHSIGGTSIFDPVLCELAYKWFCPPGGQIIDPFAGGSVRGIVAAFCGRKYWGCDLREEQVIANCAQASQICPDELPAPEWVCGDSRNTLAPEADAPFLADFVFSCPPYFNLEVYSDLPADISNMVWSDFCSAYALIIERACLRLKNNRFACFVVSDVRDQKTGAYLGLPAVTTQCFAAAGLALHNEAILVTSVGTLALRAPAGFACSRKLGRTHQNVLVYVKGDAEKAAARCEQLP